MKLLSQRPCTFQNLIDIAKLTPRVVIPVYTFSISVREQRGDFSEDGHRFIAGMTVMSGEIGDAGESG